MTRALSGPRVLIIGATGFIGSAIARALAAQGTTLRLAARDLDYGRGLIRDGDWVYANLNQLTDAAGWAALLDGVEIVINASGLLQDGPGDAVHRVQYQAIVALGAACARVGVTRIVQISAAGLHGNPSAFMTTKAAADAALLAGPVPVAVLRPGLVIDRNAYGGTQLIRLAAALPVGLHPPFGAPVRTLAMADLIDAVRRAIDADMVPQAPIDLVVDEPTQLAEIVRAHRAWLGLPRWRREWTVPRAMMQLATGLSDVAGRLGWRSPLRRSAIAALVHGVEGDAAATRHWLGRAPATLEVTLAAMPSGKQDRLAALATALLPLALATLLAMWLLSGIATLADLKTAAHLMVQGGVPGEAAALLAAAGAVADIALALMLLVRRWAQTAVLGMVLLAMLYLVLGTLMLPGLWLDPLAPFAKVLPTIALALILHPLLAHR